MRKGRSQRKARGSIPPLSTRPQALSSAPGSSGSGPQVVIGLASPRSEEAPPSLETRAADTEEGTARAAHAVLRLEALEALPAPPAPEALEAVHVDSLAGVERDVPASEAVPPSEGGLEPLSEETPEPPAIPLLAKDELSIPPAGDLAVEPIAERFFSEGELSGGSTRASEGEGDEGWEEARKAERKSLPHVIERRQRLARYVRWAVGGASILCLAAVARTALSPSARPSATASSAPVAVAAVAALAVAPAAPVVPEAVVTAPVAPVVAVEPAPAPATEPAPPAPAAAAAEDAKPAAPAATAAGADEKTALQEKNDAQRLLERGKLADAIAAGERSVALDPQDGEAWLLLGAAYQEKGNSAEARRCYAACAREGKRGPLGECRAMLH